MDFNANQMREEALIPKGKYKFRVITSREKRSSDGLQMLILKLNLFVGRKEVIHFCTLFLSPAMFWFIEHFCKAVGMPEKIDEGRIMAQDCDFKEGYLEINHRVNKKTGEIESYVKDFIIPEKLDDTEAEEPTFNDEINFN